MKTILLTLLLFLSGCSVTRKATVDQRLSFTDRSQINTSALVDTSRLSAKMKRETSLRDSTAGTITIEREYDTDKPTDPVTGKPPLKKEKITADGVKVSKADTAQAGDLEINRNLSTDQDSSLMDKTTDIKQVTASEEKKKPPWPMWVIVIIILALTGGGIYLKKKFL